MTEWQGHLLSCPGQLKTLLQPTFFLLFSTLSCFIPLFSGCWNMWIYSWEANLALFTLLLQQFQLFADPPHLMNCLDLWTLYFFWKMTQNFLTPLRHSFSSSLRTSCSTLKQKVSHIRYSPYQVNPDFIESWSICSSTCFVLVRINFKYSRPNISLLSCLSASWWSWEPGGLRGKRNFAT